MTNTTDQKMFALRAEGKTKKQIATILKSQDFKTPQNKEINEAWVSGRLAYLKSKNPKRVKQASEPMIQTISRKGGKLIALVGDRDDIEFMLQRWI